MYRFSAIVIALISLASSRGAFAEAEERQGAPHHRRHHRHHHHHLHNHEALPATQALVARGAGDVAPQAQVVQAEPSIGSDQFAGNQLQRKVQKIDQEIQSEEKVEASLPQGHLLVNGPLPADFNSRFAEAVAKAVGCKPEEVFVLHSSHSEDQPDNVQEITFQAPSPVVLAVADQAADANSKLANGALHSFLVARDSDSQQDDASALPASQGAPQEAPQVYEVVKAKPCACQLGMPPPPPTCQMTCPANGQASVCICQPGMPTPPPPCNAACPLAPTKRVEVYIANVPPADAPGEAPSNRTGQDQPFPAPKGPYMDVDLDMPYGHLEPFGREDTAQELTEQSMMESDAMVDQLEKAEVAEEKRAVFRALTRLRGAAIASFDGIARSQTGNIDQYAKVNKWREAHPVHHLASEEADVYKWAFPDKSD